MIPVIYRCLLATVNKKIHKNKHSHKMTLFWIRIAVWSSLYELVRISGSSNGSVFESLVYRIHKGHKSESPITEFGSHERVHIDATRNQTHTLIYKYTRTPNHTPIHTCTQTHTCTPTFITYTSIHIHTHYIYTYLPMHILYTHTHSHELKHTHPPCKYPCTPCTH